VLSQSCPAVALLFHYSIFPSFRFVVVWDIKVDNFLICKLSLVGSVQFSQYIVIMLERNEWVERGRLIIARESCLIHSENVACCFPLLFRNKKPESTLLAWPSRIFRTARRQHLRHHQYHRLLVLALLGSDFDFKPMRRFNQGRVLCWWNTQLPNNLTARRAGQRNKGKAEVFLIIIGHGDREHIRMLDYVV